MNEINYINHLKSYVDNGITVPDYIYKLSDKLDKLKIYNEGIKYLRNELNDYSKVILKSVGVSIN